MVDQLCRVSPWMIAVFTVFGLARTPAAAAPTPAAAPATLPPAVKGVPVGCFARVEGGGLEEVKAAGFEFVEVGLRNVVGLPDADFEQLVQRVRGLQLPVRAAINFLPPEMKVVGPEIDKGKQEEYLGRAFARAERLGLEVIVFGSGRSRSYPEGFDSKVAFRQLVEFGQRAARLARKHKLRIGIEPLGAAEASTINKVSEAVELVRAVGHPSFGITVDYYHLTHAGEPPSVLAATRGHLNHVRIANPAGRAFPLQATESDYAAFFDNLRRIGYRGGIGIETRTGTVAEHGRASNAFLRSMAATLDRRSPKSPTSR
jgi:D-psicose/D-tagatose/L-ribulose 3-epimerase